MAMFSRSKALLVLAAATMAVLPLSAAPAGERFHHRHGIQRITIRNTVRVVERTTINIRHRHHNRGRDSYSGDVAIYSRPGVGTWSYGTLSSVVETRSLASGAKIIDLRSGKNDCSMEMGVCVIRP
jgi:hypothetical protein